MAGTDESAGDDHDNAADGESAAGWQALLVAPLEVIRLLRGEPVLLIGMGAAVLLALIAIFGPDGAWVPCVILAVLVVALVVIRAVTVRRGTRTSTVGNQIDARRSEFEDVKMRARGSRGNRVRARKSTFKNVKMD